MSARGGAVEEDAGCCSRWGEQRGVSSKALQIELPYDPVIPLVGIHPKDMKTLIRKDTRIPVLQHYRPEPSYGNSQVSISR